MSIVKVIAEVNGNETLLANEGNGNYEVEMSAPQETTDVSVTAIDDVGNRTTVTEKINVDYEWLPPKINWVSTDFFNYIDYNRITNNIKYLQNLGQKLFSNIPEYKLGDEKDYTSMIYASEINAIESNLENINQSSYLLEIGETKTYYPNEKTMNYEELNRIESACLLIYNTLVAHKNALKRLSFTLGGQKGIKV